MLASPARLIFSSCLLTFQCLNQQIQSVFLPAVEHSSKWKLTQNYWINIDRVVPSLPLPRSSSNSPRTFICIFQSKEEKRKKAPENFRFLTRRRHSSARSLSTANLMMLSMSIYGCDSHLYCSSLFKVTCAMVLINSRVSLPSKITWPQLTCTPLDGLRSTCLLLRHPHLAYTWTKKSSKNSLLFYHFIVAFSARRCKCKNNSTTSDVLVREKKITADKTMSEASTK